MFTLWFKTQLLFKQIQELTPQYSQFARDNGSPLVCYLRTNTTLVGISGQGSGCEDMQNSDSYTRVAPFLKWIFINTQVSPNDEEFKRMVVNREVNEEYCHKYKKQEIALVLTTFLCLIYFLSNTPCMTQNYINKTS